MMSENRFDKTRLKQTERRKEKVPLSAGDLWAWELSAGEMMQVMERAQRPSVDPRGGIDNGSAVVWQIILACHLGPEDDAPLAFGSEDVPLILSLPWDEFRLITAAINRVNGQDPEEAELLRDFTAATRGAAASRS